MKTNTLKLITAALAPSEEILFKAWLDLLMSRYNKLVQELAEDDFNATKRYGYPSSGSMNRYDYLAQQERYNFCRQHTTTDTSRPVVMPAGTKVRDMPNYVAFNHAESKAKLTREAKENAKAAIEAFCLKMEFKVDQARIAGDTVTDVSYNGGLDPWNFSYITVNTLLSKQVWKTKMILNTSVLGKVFNQWPTTFCK